MEKELKDLNHANVAKYDSFEVEDPVETLDSEAILLGGTDFGEKYLVVDVLEKTRKPQPSPKKERFLSLDVFRGGTIMFMIIVNSQPLGTFFLFMSHADLDERETFKDFVFPFFLIIMGFAIGIVDSRKVRNPEQATRINMIELIPCVFHFWVHCCCLKIKINNRLLAFIQKWPRIFYRTIMLFLLGVGAGFIEWLFGVKGWPGPTSSTEHFDGDFRIFDVFQKISMTYLPVVLLVSVVRDTFVQIFVVLLCQLLYIVMFFLIPYPCMHGKTGIIRDDCSAQRFFDEPFGIHYTCAYGILSTLNTIGLVYYGVFLFKIMYKMKQKTERYESVVHEETDSEEEGENNRKTQKEGEVTKFYIVGAWFLVSSCALIVGIALDRLFYPATQVVWSNSFVFICCGYAGIIISILFFIIDVWKVKFWIYPFVWVGVNPLFIYVASTYLWAILRAIPVSGEENYDILYTTAKYGLRSWIKDERVCNVVFGICFELMFFPIIYFLYKKKCYIKL